jgi:hypothetical protein
MIRHHTIRIVCLIYVVRVITRLLTRARPSATQSFAKGDPIIQLVRRDGQHVTIHAGHLPAYVLGRLFGYHDMPFSSIGGTEDPCDSGMSKVVLGRIDREMGLLGLCYARRSAQQRLVFLRFPPAHRHVLDVLRDGEQVDLVCSFADKPGVTEIGVFSPA